MKELLGISEGNEFSLLLLSDGTVYSFGENKNSELGLGESAPPRTTLPKHLPSLSNIKQISAGMTHAIALTKDGLVYAWGKNNYGQVSLEIKGNVKSPYLVRPLKNIESVSAAIGYTLALDSNGHVWQWGSDSSKDVSSLEMHDGLQNIVWIGATDPFALALNDLGELYWWGSPTYFSQNPNAPTLPGKFPFDKKIIAVSAGVSHVLFKTTDGTLYGFGENYDSQLGPFYKAWDPNIPVKINIGRARSVKTFVAGRDFSAILTNNDKLYLWGTTYTPNTEQESFVYGSSTFIPVKNKLFLNLPFTNSATLPPPPSNIENAWRKLRAGELVL